MQDSKGDALSPDDIPIRLNEQDRRLEALIAMYNEDTSSDIDVTDIDDYINEIE